MGLRLGMTERMHVEGSADPQRYALAGVGTVHKLVKERPLTPTPAPVHPSPPSIASVPAPPLSSLPLLHCWPGAPARLAGGPPS